MLLELSHTWKFPNHLGSLQFSPSGKYLAAIAGNVLNFIHLANGWEPVAALDLKAELGLGNCNLSFHPTDDTLAIAGGRWVPWPDNPKTGQDYLGIAYFPDPGGPPSRCFLTKALSGSNSLALLPSNVVIAGAGTSIAWIDLEDQSLTDLVSEVVQPYEEIFSDWPLARGMKYNPVDHSVAVCWLSVCESYLYAYNLAFTVGREIERYGIGGVQHSCFCRFGFRPDFKRLAVAVGYHESNTWEGQLGDLEKQTGKFGYILVFDYEPRPVIQRFEIEAAVGTNFRITGVRDSKGNHCHYWYGIGDGMSNPVFVEDTMILFGLPGGDIGTLDTTTGKVETCARCSRNVTMLDYSTKKGLLAAGCDDGTTYVWQVKSVRNE